MSTIYDMEKSYVPVEVPKLTNDQMQWFRDSKLGMFIHWGLYSILVKETGLC